MTKRICAAVGHSQCHSQVSTCAAARWRINPYTDLAIVREPGQTQSTLFCAGLLKAKHALLRCHLGAGPGWELIA